MFPADHVRACGRTCPYWLAQNHRWQWFGSYGAERLRAETGRVFGRTVRCRLVACLRSAVHRHVGGDNVGWNGCWKGREAFAWFGLELRLDEVADYPLLASVHPRSQRCRIAASLIIIVISNKIILLFKMVLARTDRIAYKGRSVVESVVRLSARSVWLRRCRNE